MCDINQKLMPQLGTQGKYHEPSQIPIAACDEFRDFCRWTMKCNLWIPMAYHHSIQRDRSKFHQTARRFMSLLSMFLNFTYSDHGLSYLLTSCNNPRYTCYLMMSGETHYDHQFAMAHRWHKVVPNFYKLT